MESMLLLAMSHKVSLPTLEKEIEERRKENFHLQRKLVENNKIISQLQSTLNKRRQS